MASLVAVMTSWKNENLCPNRKKLHGQDQVSMEGVEKLPSVVLQVSLGRGESNMQGHCRITTANSLYPKTQVALC